MELMTMPNKDTWIVIADEYWEKWQFSNSIGVLDGKHVIILAPNCREVCTETTRKHTLSCFWRCYNFILVDVGAYERNGDGGVLLNSNF